MARLARIRRAARGIGSAVRARAWILGRLLACLAIAAVLAVLPVYVNSVYGYLPILMYLSLILLCFAYVRILGHLLTFEELSALESCQRGTSMDFAVRLTNKGPLFFPKVTVRFFISDLFGHMDTLRDSVITLAPFEVRDFMFDIRFDHVGRYQAGLQEMILSDPVGLFRITIPGTRMCTVEVTPRIYDLAELETLTEESPESIERVLSVSENSMDYATVREYAWGDPLKSIHWNLSSRTPNGEYLTRLFESYSNPSIDVVLDFCCPAGLDAEARMGLFDALLEVAFSLRQWADEQGMGCRLVYRSRTGEDRQLDAHADAWSALEAIKDMPLISDDRSLAGDMPELLARTGRSLYSTNMAVITSRLDDQTVQACVNAKAPKKQVMLFALLQAGMDSGQRAEAVRPLNGLLGFGIPCYALADACELEGVGHDAS